MSVNIVFWWCIAAKNVKLAAQTRRHHKTSSFWGPLGLLYAMSGWEFCLSETARAQTTNQFKFWILFKLHLWPTHGVTDGCGCLWSKVGFVASVTASTAMSRESLSHWKSAKTRFPGCVKGNILKPAVFPINVSTETLWAMPTVHLSPSLERFARQRFPNKPPILPKLTQKVAPRISHVG